MSGPVEVGGYLTHEAYVRIVLAFRDGRSLVLTAREADELAEAIQQALREQQAALDESLAHYRARREATP